MKPTVLRRRVLVALAERGGGPGAPFLGRRVALVGLGGQPTEEELVPGVGDADQPGLDLVRGRREDPGDQPPDHGGGGERVGGRPDRAPQLHLLGGAVVGSAAEDGRLARRALLVLGQAEVADHHAFVPIEQARPERCGLGDPVAAGPGDDQEVPGLHVPVDDAGFVQRSQPLRERPDDRLEAVRVDPGTVRQPVVQRAAARRTP